MNPATRKYEIHRLQVGLQRHEISVIQIPINYHEQNGGGSLMPISVDAAKETNTPVQPLFITKTLPVLTTEGKSLDLVEGMNKFIKT